MCVGWPAWSADTDARMAELDAYALHAPTAAAASVAALTAYLIAPARNDLEKTRVIFRWITANIAYDTASYFSGEAGPTAVDDVLKQKTSVCGGYADLFSQLAHEAGLEVVSISGFAKGYGYIVGQSVDNKTNHAWNAVKIDGEWRLLDATWGAGSIDDRKQFVRAFNPHYFLTPPEEMIFDHFPVDPHWQLLDPPVTREVFARYVRVHPAFFRDGLHLESHLEAAITVAEALMVTLRLTSDTAVLVDLLQDENKLPGMAFAQREGDKLVIRAVFPRPGDYVLRLYTRPRTADGPYESALDYQVRAVVGTPAAGFPTVYGVFSRTQGQLHTPFARSLPASKNVVFDLTCPGAIEVAVVCGKTWTKLPCNGARFTGPAPIAPGAVEICAKYPGRDDYDVLLVYDGE